MTLALAATVFLNGCSRGDSQAKKGGMPVPVLVAQSVEKNVPVQIHAIGNVTPISKVTIRSQITGKLESVNFREGQPVKTGDLLFTFDPRPPQAALARDQALLENAKIQFVREQKLFDQKLISQDEYDTSKATRDTLAATVQADELNLGYCEIRSPIDGVTGSQQVFEGNIVKSPDDVMLMINQIHPIYVTFAVPEQYLSEIRREMAGKTLKVQASFAGMSGPTPEGDLTFVDNSVDTTTGTIQLKATFANEDNKLWPGQFVEVSLTLSEISNAVLAPNQAIQTGQNGEYVFIVKSDQTVEMRPVKTGESFQGETVVSSGLKAGETVVTDGQLNLVPGKTVDIKSSSVVGTATNDAPGQP